MAVLTVTELNRYMKRMIECDPNLNRVTVKGELSNCKLHYSGHLYFSLKDEGAVVRCVMFRSSVVMLPFTPESGQKVIVSGRIGVYERDGQYQLYANDLQPDGVGALYLAYEQLRRQLEEEGLFDPSRKKPLPRFPRKIGVITSPTGAAIRDILNILSRRYALANVYLYPVLVQGAEAPAELIEALRYFHTTGWADVLIIGRGGGSIEDLWAFNDEGVARAIAACRIPVISAVGHETDVTIADFAADLRAPTPSAAAELAVPDQAELTVRMRSFSERLARAYLSGMEQKSLRLKRCAEHRVFARPQEMIEDRQLCLEDAAQGFFRAAQQQISRKEADLALRSGRLDALSPLAVLSRGYAAVSDQNGGAVTSVGGLNEGDLLSLRFSDGEAQCRVNSRSGKKEEENNGD